MMKIREFVRLVKANRGMGHRWLEAKLWEYQVRRDYGVEVIDL